VKVVQVVAGHSTVTTTVDPYGHLIAGDLDLAREALARSIERSGWVSQRPSPFREPRSAWERRGI
jgi:hypothetical protein